MDLSIAVILSPEDRDLFAECQSTLPLGCELVVVETHHSDFVNSTRVREERALNNDGYVRVIERFAPTFDFAEARNIAANYCTRSWILAIDADERLIPAQHDELCAIVENADSDVVAAYVTVSGRVLNATGALTMADRFAIPALRLYRNHCGITWSGKCHERIYPSVKKMTGKSIVDTDIFFQHKGYAVSQEQLHKKLNRNFDMLTAEYAVSKDEHYREYLLRTAHQLYEVEAAKQTN